MLSSSSILLQGLFTCAMVSFVASWKPRGCRVTAQSDRLSGLPVAALAKGALSCVVTLLLVDLLRLDSKGVAMSILHVFGGSLTLARPVHMRLSLARRHSMLAE